MPVEGSFTHKLIAVCSTSMGVSLVDLYSGNRTQTIRQNLGDATCCCWNPLNEFELVVGDSRGYAFCYDIRKSELNNMLGVLGNTPQSAPASISETPIQSILFSPNGSTIVCTSSETHPIKLFYGNTYDAMDIPVEGVSPWGNVIPKPCVAGEGDQSFLFFPDPTDCTVKVVDLSSGKIVNVLRGHLDAATCCSFRRSRNELCGIGESETQIFGRTRRVRAEMGQSARE